MLVLVWRVHCRLRGEVGSAKPPIRLLPPPVSAGTRRRQVPVLASERARRNWTLPSLAQALTVDSRPSGASGSEGFSASAARACAPLPIPGSRVGDESNDNCYSRGPKQDCKPKVA